MTLGVLRSQINNINVQATREAKIQDEKNVALFCQKAKNIKDLSFAMKRGMLFLKLKRYREASAILDQATTLDNNYRDSWFWAGYANLKDLENRQKELPRKDQDVILTRSKTDLAGAQRIDPLYPQTSQLMAAISKGENDDKGKSLWYARYETVSGKKSNMIEMTKNNP